MKKFTIEDCPNPYALQVHTREPIHIYSKLKDIVEAVPGVEKIDTWGVHKYSFLLQFSHAYTASEIKEVLGKRLNEFFGT